MRCRRSCKTKPHWLGACFAAACLAFLSAPNGEATERKVDLELVLAADISGSMDKKEAALQRRGFIHALRHPDVIAAIRRGRYGRIALTYVEWAGEHNQNSLVAWREISDRTGIAEFTKALAGPDVRIGQWTSIGTMIDFAARDFETNGYRGERRIIDISGDGPNNSGDFVTYARDRAVSLGITINGLPIVNNRPSPQGYPPMPDLDLYYEDCVIGGLGAFIVVADGFADFARAVRRKLVLEIAGRAPTTALLRLAAARPRPPCNAGEIQLRKFRPSSVFRPTSFFGYQGPDPLTGFPN
jgi:hypothetical protein